MARLTITSARLIHPRPYGRIPVTSTEELRVWVQGAGLSHNQRPYVAIITPGGQPAPHDWKRARWDPQPQDPQFEYVIELMIGQQSAVRVSKGDKRIWVRVDDPPVTVHRHAGHLIFT